MPWLCTSGTRKSIINASVRYLEPVLRTRYLYIGMSDENNLQRFITAQETFYDTALAEIKKGRKQSHWMWYIFPQIQGLGFSETSKFYAIKDINEAKEFLMHPVLGERLIRICNELLQPRRE